VNLPSKNMHGIHSKMRVMILYMKILEQMYVKFQEYKS